MGSIDQHRPASIEDLPGELLATIFHLVHHESVAEFYEPANDDPFEKKWFLRPDFILPRFPGAVAEVSLRWQAIVSSVPEFWTVLVFVIDSSKPVPISHIQTCIERSSDLPLDILVTRLPGCPTLTSEEEKALLSPLVAVFAPSLHRCRSFSFYATHSSALPKLGRDILGTLSNLTKLRLECEMDDGGASPAPEGTLVSCPKLHSLTLDGHGFIKMTNMDDLWPLQFPQLKSLSILRLVSLSHEDTTAGRERLSLYDFLDLLAAQSLNLDYLRLCDFELTNPVPEDFTADLNLSRALIVEDLTPTFTYDLFSSVSLYTPELHISRCSLNAMGSLPRTTTLRLEEISEFDNLATHLKHWRGEALACVRCDGFDNEFLDMLGAVSIYAGATHLAKLTIIDCTNFTVKALRKMVESRNKKVEAGAEWPGRPAIEELVVIGKGPALETADKEWLSGKLKGLHWNTLADGESSCKC